MMFKKCKLFKLSREIQSLNTMCIRILILLKKLMYIFWIEFTSLNSFTDVCFFMGGGDARQIASYRKSLTKKNLKILAEILNFHQICFIKSKYPLENYLRNFIYFGMTHFDILTKLCTE